MPKERIEISPTHVEIVEHVPRCRITWCTVPNPEHCPLAI